MLKTEKPDIVDVSTPTYLHAEHAIAAMRAGAHVICEKPMALCREDAKKIIEVSRETGRLFMAAHVLRFMGPYAYLADVIRSGKYGAPKKIYMSRLSSTPLWSYKDWMLDKSLSGHVVLDLMIHDIDFMQYMFGQPKDITGAVMEMSEQTNYASACYLYDGFSVSIEGSWFKTEIPFICEYFAVFEGGWVRLDNGVLLDNGQPVDLDRSEVVENTGINISSADGYTQEIRHFIECVRTGTAPAVTPESSADSVSLVHKTLDSLKKI
jgi:predicted dehydrogenase